jgi:hypothetical protein
MLTSLRAARRDLTVPPRFEAPPVPHTFTLGPGEVRAVGLTHALSPPLGPTPVRLGPPAGPALHYPIGDGTDPRGWHTFRGLTRHLERGTPA